MRILSWFALILNFCLIYFQTALAYPSARRPASSGFLLSGLDSQKNEPKQQAKAQYRDNAFRGKEGEVLSLVRRSPPPISLQKRGPGHSKSSRKQEQQPQPVPPRIISIQSLGSPSLKRTPAISIPGSPSRPGQSTLLFPQSSGGSTNFGSTPPKSSSLYHHTSGDSSTSGTPRSSPPDQRLPSTRRVSKGNSMFGSVTVQPPPNTLPSESNAKNKQSTSKSESGSSRSQKLTPAIQRDSASKMLEDPKRTFRRPEPGTYSTWSTNSGRDSPSASSRSSGQSDSKADISNSPPRSKDATGKPPSGNVPSSLRLTKPDATVQASQRPSSPRENLSRSNPPANSIPLHSLGGLFTQTPAARHAQSLDHHGAFTQLPSTRQPSSTSLNSDTVFTRPPRGSFAAYGTTTRPSTASNKQSPRPPNDPKPPSRSPSPPRSPQSPPPSSASLMKANIATSKFYRSLANLPRTNNAEQNAKQQRWGLLSNVHSLASEFYAQDPKPSSVTLGSTSVPSIVESAPDPSQQGVHRTTANFYRNLVSNPTSSVPLSAAKQDEYRLLAKYHDAVAKYYAEPNMGGATGLSGSR